MQDEYQQITEHINIPWNQNFDETRSTRFRASFVSFTPVSYSKYDNKLVLITK